MTGFSDQEQKHLEANVTAILDSIPERDSEFELYEFSQEFFDQMEQDPLHWQFQLVVCQLALKEFHFSSSMRIAIRRRLLDFARPPNKATLILASDLINTPHIQKPNKTSVLARDVLIIVCLALLQELGYKLTRGETTQADGISGSQYVFEHLVARGLTFADNARAVEQIWTRRHDKWRKLGFDRCPFDKKT